MMLDIIDAGTVEVTVDTTGKLWVNIDGKCALRIEHCRLIVMDDHLRGQGVIYDETAITSART
jgi:hypothetical protein